MELERQMAENQAKLAMMSAQDKEAKQKDYINMQKVRFSLTKIQTWFVAYRFYLVSSKKIFFIELMG